MPQTPFFWASLWFCTPQLVEVGTRKLTMGRIIPPGHLVAGQRPCLVSPLSGLSHVKISNPVKTPISWPATHNYAYMWYCYNSLMFLFCGEANHKSSHTIPKSCNFYHPKSGKLSHDPPDLIAYPGLCVLWCFASRPHQTMLWAGWFYGSYPKLWYL